MTQSITETRLAPLAGHVQWSTNRINAEYRTRSAVSQIATSNLTGAFDGTRDLGFFYGGPMAYGPNAANVAAWLVLVNAALAGEAVVTHNAGVITVTSLDFAAHALSPFNPNTGDLDLSAFTVTTAAVAAPVLKAGTAVVWKDRTLRTVQAPLPTSTLLDYVGVVDRMAIHARDLAIAWASGVEGALIAGQRLIAHRKCSAYLQVAPGVTVTASNPVYFGRLPTEAGYYYGADDGGNTRLIIPDAQWMATGTGAAGQGVQALFQ